MKFLKGLWKLLVGIKDFMVLTLLMLFFGALYAMLSFTPHPGGPARGALTIRLDGPVVEQPAEADPLAALAGRAVPREYRLAEIIRALDAAASDDNVPAVALDLDIFAGGRQAALADVGAAIDRVRRAGKPVLAYATFYSDDTYQLASHASEVWMHPLGGIAIAGPGGDNLYYAGLLERLGITANIYRVGAFKSAVEPYARRDMSPEARAMQQQLADAMWTAYRAEVHAARPAAQLEAYVGAPSQAIAQHNGDMAEAALRMGFVDHIGDQGQFNARMAQLVGTGDPSLNNSYRTIALDTYVQRFPVGSESGDIAVLTIAGEIRDGEAGPGTAGAETIVRTLDDGFRRNAFRALVVRIDSPGGSVTGSERIRQAIQRVRDRGVPVIVSMGSLAASGGYWVATPAQRIFAEPTTLTGSIGVFGMLPSFEGALRNLAVGVDGVRTTPLSGEPNVLRGPSDEADRMLQLGVEGNYRRFLNLVSRSRNLPVSRVHEIAQGRVWDGGTARQIGLVDQFGTLQDAIAEAARRANITDAAPATVYLQPETNWFTRYFGGRPTVAAQAPSDPYAPIARRPQLLLAQALGEARALLEGPAIQARCLECGPARAISLDEANQTLWSALFARFQP